MDDKSFEKKKIFLKKKKVTTHFMTLEFIGVFLFWKDFTLLLCFDTFYFILHRPISRSIMCGCTIVITTTSFLAAYISSIELKILKSLQKFAEILRHEIFFRMSQRMENV